ncbi:hypothetical protein QFC22_001276 [Naganishia vaughanmartiniae]|uniref:Uncharacterized protein n=1 Tax=Naganishia vaughanmartiniae TaxID=1424756 RepID=A0ACC2XJ69_9TREE|nr:hypothetical protein QFC22_001276 [Naganishia vaughanmartiniae]
MQQTTALPTHHADLVTDVAYDYYGERLATASADQKIKVWKKDPVKGTWDLEDEWKAHDAPILQLTWSHPEHSNLLASCSYDRSVRIWEEVSVPAASRNVSNGNLTMGGANHSSALGKRWVECGLLMDARGSVRNIEFAPNAFGLKLTNSRRDPFVQATISTDSYVRIYTCLSPTLSDWQLTTTVSLPSLQFSQAAKSHTNNVSAGGNDDATQPHQSSAAGGAGGLTLTNALSQSSNSTSSTSNNSANAPNPGKGNEALGGWCLSWCKERWWGQVMAATSGHSGIIKIISLSTPTPTAILILHPPPATATNSISSNGTPNSSTASQGLGAQAITSLAWSPACGRSYHLIASGHRDGSVRIWKVWPPAIGGDGVGNAGGADEQSGAGWKADIAAEWGRGDVMVGKVEWNLTGSILSVASEDGKVRLFKGTFAISPATSPVSSRLAHD